MKGVALSVFFVLLGCNGSRFESEQTSADVESEPTVAATDAALSIGDSALTDAATHDAAADVADAPPALEPGDHCLVSGLSCPDRFYCDGEYCVASSGPGEPCTVSMPCRPDLRCERPSGEPPADGDNDATCVPVW